ncbi:AraC family transcriptional regulator CmrA [Caulobacter sp. D4A]|nr:AraC family transcriptional regulator CmrA [Caulobacter sp. D4A]PXA88827.1 AraC family transcriptional regulator CmrA [Caulobacter sp. D5]
MQTSPASTPVGCPRHPALAEAIERSMPADGVHPTAIPGMWLARMSQPSPPVHGVHEAAVCIIAQGRKQVMLGEEVYVYDHARFLVVSVDVPVVGQVIEASDDAPYLCVRLDIDPRRLNELILEIDPGPVRNAPAPGMALSETTPELLDATVRLVRLLETPGDIPVLAPLIQREILYRLLRTDQGPRLREIAACESRLGQVSRAIHWLRTNYHLPFRMETLASEARMSPSALHQHFKAVTAMSPLQYQKQLRLQEARRLILAQGLDAATAGHNVGYDSPSQFSREYARLFGAPPLRDATRLRARPELVRTA